MVLTGLLRPLEPPEPHKHGGRDQCKGRQNQIKAPIANIEERPDKHATKRRREQDFQHYQCFLRKVYALVVVLHSDLGSLY